LAPAPAMITFNGFFGLGAFLNEEDNAAASA
jgi:hypothetical protein